MLKKILHLSLLCLSVSQLTADENGEANSTSQVGRFQISTSNVYNHATELYLIDTTNGSVWRTSENYGCEGLFYESWEKLPPLPIEE